MNYPQFFDNVEPIRLVDKLSAVLGAIDDGIGGKFARHGLMEFEADIPGIIPGQVATEAGVDLQ